MSKKVFREKRAWLTQGNKQDSGKAGSSYTRKKKAGASVSDQKGRSHYFYLMRRLFQVAALAFCLAAMVLMWPRLWSWLNQPITRVEVHAPFVYLQKSQVEALLAPRLDERFFQLDLAGIRALLLEQAWIREASIRKEWPDRLVVSLEEKESVARWYNRQLISAEGLVFAPSSINGFEKLPVLKGPKRQAQEVMQQYLAISQLLRPLGLIVNELELGRTGAWSFKVGGVQVNIGRDQRMERLQRLVRLYHARLESRWKSVKRIDLRYPNGASVAWGDK